MLVQIRYFASVREIVGVSQETHDLPEAVLTVGQARDWLRAQGGRYALALAAEKDPADKEASKGDLPADHPLRPDELGVTV